MSTDQLADQIARGLRILALSLANPKEVSPELIRAWTLALGAARVRPEEVEPTIGRLLTTATFFPAPADFLKALRPPEDEAVATEGAWQQVLAAVRTVGRFGSLTHRDVGEDAAALWAVSRLGWGRLCGELAEDNRQFWRAEFARVYALARKEGHSLRYLAGSQELQNDADGRELTPILCGRPDWKELPPERSEPAPALPEGGRELPAFVPRALPAGYEDEDIPERRREWAAR